MGGLRPVTCSLGYTKQKGATPMSFTWRSQSQTTPSPSLLIKTQGVRSGLDWHTQNGRSMEDQLFDWYMKEGPLNANPPLLPFSSLITSWRTVGGPAGRTVQSINEWLHSSSIAYPRDCNTISVLLLPKSCASQRPVPGNSVGFLTIFVKAISETCNWYGSMGVCPLFWPWIGDNFD